MKLWVNQEIIESDDLNANFAEVDLKLSDGSDGDVTVADGESATLTRHMYYDVLEVNGTLNTDGYIIYAKVIRGNGTIRFNGNDGANGTTPASAGSAGTGGTGGASAGGYFTTNVGATGSTSNLKTAVSAGGNSDNVTITPSAKQGGNAGAGGTSNSVCGGTSVTGGVAGSAGSATAPTTDYWKEWFKLVLIGMSYGGDGPNWNIINPGSAGAGGGAGGGAESGATDTSGGGGGGGGASGGILLIFAKTIEGNITLESKGGDGGDGGDGCNALQGGAGGGGGGGGAGGIIILVYVNSNWGGTFNVSAGVGGTKGVENSPDCGSAHANGADGSDGTDGATFELYMPDLIR